MTKEYPEVDGQCSICRAKKEVTAYRMYATCQNCGTQVIAMLSKGHEAHHLSAECPECGNRHWTIQHLILSGSEVYPTK